MVTRAGRWASLTCSGDSGGGGLRGVHFPELRIGLIQFWLRFIYSNVEGDQELGVWGCWSTIWSMVLSWLYLFCLSSFICQMGVTHLSTLPCGEPATSGGWLKVL